MSRRLSTHLMLRPEDVPPSHIGWEVIGAFNPGAVRIGKEVVLLVRIAERPKEARAGYIALPRWTPDDGLAIDWARNDDVEFLDPRVVRMRDEGNVRLTFISHLRLAYSSDGRTIDRIGAIALAPGSINEEYGVEDPRITPLDGRYYITYVAVSRYGAATALASTTDFHSFERHGVIFCPENKDVLLFPERVGGQYTALHRPVGGTPFTKPQMWIAYSHDLLHWGGHRYLYGGRHSWESGRVGGGTPPILTDIGWLEVYHGNLNSEAPGDVGAYFGAAMLLDANDPSRVVRTGNKPLLTPDLDFEREGFVANVVFPTAIIPEDDRLFIYYGASDKYSAVVEMKLGDVLEALE